MHGGQGRAGGEAAAGRTYRRYWPASKSSVNRRQNSAVDSRNQRHSSSELSSLEFSLDAILNQGSGDLVKFDAGWPDVDSLQSTCTDLAQHLILHNRLQQDHRPKHCQRIQQDPSQLYFCVGRFELNLPPCAKSAMATPVLDRFLTSLAELVSTRDGEKLQDFLQIEPPLPDIYGQMVVELKTRYPNGEGDAELLKRCEALVPKTKGGTSWTAFPVFMKLYFAFLRDVNVENLLETYDRLKALLK